ncbi:hypothetical protein HDU76_011694 [Blyttiomyces sp. JEL0837]|nr:hypothetical protein HDU76_011694 [Blyttiomyces sp. JEL0837]
MFINQRKWARQLQLSEAIFLKILKTERTPSAEPGVALPERAELSQLKESQAKVKQAYSVCKESFRAQEEKMAELRNEMTATNNLREQEKQAYLKRIQQERSVSARLREEQMAESARLREQVLILQQQHETSNAAQKQLQTENENLKKQLGAFVTTKASMESEYNDYFHMDYEAILEKDLSLEYVDGVAVGPLPTELKDELFHDCIGFTLKTSGLNMREKWSLLKKISQAKLRNALREGQARKESVNQHDLEAAESPSFLSELLDNLNQQQHHHQKDEQLQLEKETLQKQIDTAKESLAAAQNEINGLRKALHLAQKDTADMRLKSGDKVTEKLMLLNNLCASYRSNLLNAEATDAALRKDLAAEQAMTKNLRLQLETSQNQAATLGARLEEAENNPDNAYDLSKPVISGPNSTSDLPVLPDRRVSSGTARISSKSQTILNLTDLPNRQQRQRQQPDVSGQIRAQGSVGATGDKDQQRRKVGVQIKQRPVWK